MVGIVPRRAFLALLVSVALLGSAAPARADDVSDAQDRVATAEADVARLRDEYVVLAEQARGVDGRADQARLRVLSLQRAMDDAESDLREARHAVSTRARRAYMGDPLGNLTALLHVQEYAQIDAYYPYVVRPLEDDRRAAVVLQQKVSGFKRLQGDLDVARDDATKKASDLATVETRLRRNLEQQQAALTAARGALEEAKRKRLEQELRYPRFSGFVPRGPQRGSGPGPEAGIPDPTGIPPAPRVLPNGVELGPVAGVPAGMQATGQKFSGVASWYGPGFHGYTTSNGETYDQYGFTAASRDLPFDTVLLVTYRDKSVLLRVNDRGPADPNRVLDLSKGAADALGIGLGYVDAEVVIPVA